MNYKVNVEILPPEDQDIRLRFCRVPKWFITESLIMPEAKLNQYLSMMFEKLGIVRKEGQTWSDAWLSMECLLNGLPDVRPVPRPLAQAIVSDTEALAFYWCITQ